MDLEILKKKISTFRGEGGRIRNVSDELLIEILLAWEQWTGPSKGFYGSLGVSAKGMASIIGKGKKLKREGFPTEDFKEIRIEEGSLGPPIAGSGEIEMTWENGKVIRFHRVDQLVDFLKKVA